jgi:hypothetical protein
VKQTHIKNCPKALQLQVGGMGLTFYDKNMKLVGNIMYQNVLSWKSQPTTKSISIQMAPPNDSKGKGAKGATTKKNAKEVMIIIKTEESEKIVGLMETKATQLAKEYRVRKNFAITQGHLAEVAPCLELQVRHGTCMC